MDAVSSDEKDLAVTAPFFAPVSVSTYFDPADLAFCEALDRFLAPLKRNGHIHTWDARHISAGQEWESEYDRHLTTDPLLILLLSPDFLASEACHQHMSLALRRYQEDESVVVVPILVRPCLWQETELQDLQILPKTHQALSLEIHPEVVWQEIAAEISQIIGTIQQRVFVIYAPEDQGVVKRLQQDIANSSVALWSLDVDQLSSNLGQHTRARDAMRQASGVILIDSPAARSSRAVNAQIELAADYYRPILVFWAKGEGGGRPTQEHRHTEMVLDARNERYKDACRMLVAWLKQREAKGHSLLGPPTFLSEPRNPYKGLQTFTADDARDFFGRETFIDDLISTLKQTLALEQQGKQQERLLAVVGASGSGKSSVVLAGLLPQLQNGAIGNSQEWVYLDPILPGVHPLEALAISLAQQPSLGNAVDIHTALTSDSLRTLHLLASQIASSSSRKVVLFVDQFEEIFTLTVAEEERRHFFDLLITAISEPRGPLLVLMTFRADFYEHPMQYPMLFLILDTHRVPILPMKREDLRQVIEEPANLPDVQISFEENLVGDLLFDMREQVGTLPLLQFTLDQLFAHCSGHQVTLQAYYEIGGVKGALTKHAEASYAALPSEMHRELTRILFLRLIDPGITKQDMTCRRATFAEFELPDPTQTTILRETIAAFIAARLLTANEYASTTTLEVSHEVLIREWPRLVDWLREAREDIRLQQTISKDATEWQQRQQSKDHLYQGRKLKEARDWAKRNTPSQNEVAFLRASIRQRLLFFVNTILIVLLFNDGKLALTNSVISNNRTIGFYADGGGIFNRKGMLTLTNSTISGNRVSSTNSYSRGGGIFNGETLTLTNSIISGNTASSSNSNSYGGGIFNERALALTNSTISGNTATGTGSTSEGGGISNGGTSTLTNSTISDNTTSNSTSEGGGISNRGILTLTNDTIFGNKASSSGSHGGGISNYSIVTITFSTLCGNIAQNGGGISTQQHYLSQPERLMVSNSLIAGNHASIHLDISGKLISGGYNLIQNTAGITFLDPNPKYDTDITGTPISDLHIDGELRRNGGSPLTLALLPGSPAINAIPLEACRIEGVTTDQRGVLRPQGTGCDIGAYEYK